LISALISTALSGERGSDGISRIPMLPAGYNKKNLTLL
jgi:hypothetical protein